MSETERQFPILDSSARHFPDLPRSVPWSLLEPHREAAINNHGQTLERLAQRGGLGWSELHFVVNNLRWHFETYTRDQERVLAQAIIAKIALTKDSSNEVGS